VSDSYIVPTTMWILTSQKKKHVGIHTMAIYIIYGCTWASLDHRCQSATVL
jgi:hypothetical protein